MSRISLAYPDKDSDSVLLSNRTKFKKIFSKHLPNREGKISLQEFLKFCQNVRILQDLISPIDMKKLIAQHNIKQNISYSEFESLIKSIAMQTFNNTAPLFDKLRMLMIHIRNSCKMHYQVSLNQNFIKEAIDCECMQDPVEIDGHSPDDMLRVTENQDRVYKSRYTSVSPPGDNDSVNKTRINSAKKEIRKDKSVSPCNSIEILDKVLQKRFNSKAKINTANKPKTSFIDELNRTKSVSPYRSVSPLVSSPFQNVKNVFFGFCNQFNNTVSTVPKSYTVRRVQAQLKFIQTVRKNTFKGEFVKKLIFCSWRQLVRDRIYKSS
ncbi:hypothetical protein SteCoe_30835 [Stentor coeruleus]|uniref:EF-hand domain-containing protein n=1 Tax=Stentor coeruleus TaxID=5963 RepID=A0A1R2B2Z4_9CILI|nr:hypothetical protein SteCoe_30835 [Stentor coeruleus]